MPRYPSQPDVIVVGAGPSGVTAAASLRARGRSVLLLDAGPRLPASRQRPPEVDRRLWSCTTVGETWDWTRVRAIGGRSLLWGGWSARLPAEVLDRGGWPTDLATLTPWYEAAERTLPLVTGTLDARYAALAAEAGVTVLPKRAPLLRGGALWNARRTAEARHAHSLVAATRVEHEHGRAVALETVDLRTGRPRRLTARALVLAASPLETTRILLRSDLGGGVGDGLVDHMVSSWVLVEPAPPPPTAGRGAFPGQAFVDRFVNIGGDTERSYRGGFTLELSGPVHLEAIDLERLVSPSERPSTRATLVHAIGELHPLPGRRVDLDPRVRDALDRPVPRVHWAWSDEERALADDLATACTQVADAMALPGSRLIRLSDPLVAGAGHEAGTCAMGGEGAPTDPWGRLRALSNVWIADASALPTAGDRHPTLTVLAHALRAAADVDLRLG